MVPHLDSTQLFEIIKKNMYKVAEFQHSDVPILVLRKRMSSLLLFAEKACKFRLDLMSCIC